MAQNSSSSTPQNDPTQLPDAWQGSEQIGMLLYPQFTALDLIGPQHFFAALMGAKVHLVAKTAEPVISDTGVPIVPTATFENCPQDLDILFIPGASQGTLDAMNDQDTLNFIKDRGQKAKWVTSVCTGSLLLARAGLLQGYKATSHWGARDLLSHFGAIPVDQRIVQDRNRLTGAGVSAGLDLGLHMAALLRDEQYAQGLQLVAEYAPEPPFNSGTPHTAGQPTTELISSMFTPFREQVLQMPQLQIPKGTD